MEKFCRKKSVRVGTIKTIAFVKSYMFPGVQNREVTIGADLNGHKWKPILAKLWVRL